MNLLLSETLPLRTTRMLGDFAEDEVLPQRFGDLRHSRFRLIKLSLTEWFAADHPMPISNVYIDDEETDGWAQELRMMTPRLIARLNAGRKGRIEQIRWTIGPLDDARA